MNLPTPAAPAPTTPDKAKKARSIKLRITFGTLMAVGFIALLWGDWKLEQSRYLGLLPANFHGVLFALFTVLLAFAASFELCQMIRAKDLRPLTFTAALCTAGLALSPLVAKIHPEVTMLPAWMLAFSVMLIFLVHAATRRTANAVVNIAATLLPVCYLGGLALFIVWIRSDLGIAGLLLYLATVKCTDVGAWAVGISIGRHKMIPWLSPGKSWEGMGGGLAAAILAALAVGLGSGLIGWWQAIVYGLVMAPVGQCGDLAESLLKRDCGLKDSGQVVPGFGGLLDILDSPLGAAPIGYLLLKLLA